MAPDAVAAIINDHRRIEGLLERLATGVHDPMGLLDEIEIRLTAHNRAEEDHVYPAILDNGPHEAGEVYHGYEEHHQATALLYRLKAMDPRSVDFRSTTREFVEAVKRHVDEEEATILPRMTEGVDKKLLTKLGKEFDRRRISELAAHGIPGDGKASGTGKRASYRASGPRPAEKPDRAPGSRSDGSRSDGSRSDGSRSDGSRSDGSRSDRKSGPVVDSADVELMTRDELYQRAERAGIPGRPGMSRDELARALQMVPAARKASR